MKKESKIIAIGDTHGRSNWKTCLPSDLSDVKRLVFIGDYFDTHDDITQHEQIENFKDILEFKKANIDKVILLIGNHDFHYMGDQKLRYSGFEEAISLDIKELLHEALSGGLIQACHVEPTDDIDVLFSHAGVTKTWLTNNITNEFINLKELEGSVNSLFNHKPNRFEFTAGDNYNPYGDEICQTPIWVRPRSLMSDPLDQNVLQVVGHTQHKEITVNGKYIFIDVLDKKPNEYLTLQS